jgi:hypothetical protein
MDNVCDTCRWYETDGNLNLEGVCTNPDSPDFSDPVYWDYGCSEYEHGQPMELFEMPTERAVMEAL